METLSIFGSCMSRDAFRLHPVEGIELKSYIARQSIHSAVAKPMEIPVPMETIQNVSPFNQRMVYQDLNKTTFDVLGKDGSKWAMLDLIDERFALVYWGGDTCHRIQRVREKRKLFRCTESPTQI